MRGKWFAILLINLVSILMIKPSFAGEASKTSEDQTGVIFVQTTILNGVNRTMSHWDTNRNAYGLDQNPQSGAIDFPIDLPVPLQIDSSVQDAFDAANRSRLAPKWEEKNLYPTLGIKYSFSSFGLKDFAKSFASLFLSANQDSPRNRHRGDHPVSFYLAFPEY